jgi:Ni/Co efflux regulator RcnB
MSEIRGTRPLAAALAAAMTTALALWPATAPAGDHKGTPPGLAKKDGHPSRGVGSYGIPPGQAKKYARGDRLGDGWVRIDDLGRYRLPRPRDGNVYVRLDGEVYEVIRDTATVVEAWGIVSDWLR